MSFKKTSSLYKAGFILTAIIIVSIIYFLLSDYYINSEQNSLNSAKLVKVNSVLLNKINALSEHIEFYQSEMLKSAELFDDNLSTLINGGSFFEEDEEIFLSVPGNEDLKKIKNLENIWVQYYTSLKQLSKIKYNATAINEFSENFEDISLILKNLENDYIKLSKNESLILKIIHFIAIILYITISIILYLFIKKKFSEPIKIVENIVANIAVGKQLNQKINYGNDFFNVQTNLEKLHNKTIEISHFVNQLVNDNYDVKFEDYNKDVALENSLVKLRNKLKENIELNKKRLEEERVRQWFSEGQAKFNDILRESSSSINKLAEASIKNIVKFFNVAQGGFFILNDETNEPFLSLSSAFAYDRIKSINKKIPVGEGLIGMCALERNTIWLNNVPDDYMEIESGLGEAPPTNILIIPLKTDERILGVIEIASFYEFSKDEVDFLETIAEDIASTLETTKITDKTSVLLEETRKKSTELAYRDTEMSEKVQQLKQTQQELRKIETEVSNLLSAVNNVLIKIELNTRGKISSVNQMFLRTLNLIPSQINNRLLSELIKTEDKSLLDNIIKEVKNGKPANVELTFSLKDKSIVKLKSHFSPVKNEKGIVTKILLLAENISHNEEAENKNKLLSEKNIEFKKSINELKIKSERTQEELKKYIEKENLIKEKFESGKDKKYIQWLSSFKS